MSAQGKSRAVTAIRDAIKAIDREQREPDPWEKYQLTLALGSALQGHWGYATARAEQALTPPAERVRFEGYPEFEHLDLAALRTLLAKVEVTLIRDNPDDEHE